MGVSRIINLRIEQIYPHPDNPRKDVGDVSELAESIRKNGIMQNLTVMPISALTAEPDDQPGVEDISEKSDFCVLIGHRRLAASKMAGLSEVPCKVVSKISKRVQVGIMLEENMQRNDLTILEQAQGFQMMMNLGETEETIAEKTGFSRTTIRHRLNIAKLDPKIIKKKENEGYFQLSMKDYQELEKVSNVKTRNTILAEAQDSRNLAWKVQEAVNKELRNKNKKQLVPLLEQAGVKPAPKAAENEQYSGKWETVKEFNLEKDVPKEVKFRGTDQLYYLEYYRSMRIIKKAKPKKASAHELEQKKINANRKKIKEMANEMAAERKDLLLSVVSGKLPALKDVTELRETLWKCLLSGGAYVSFDRVADVFREKESWKYSEEENQEFRKKAEELEFIHQLLIVACMDANKTELVDYCGKFGIREGRTLQLLYQALSMYGMSLSADEEALINGTHELYAVAGK